MRAGANEVIGEIASVNVTSTTSTSETGTVTIDISQVIAGNVRAQMIQFPYSRTLVETDSPENWDFISPLGESLKDAVGAKLLIFFTVANDTYSIFQASNAVQLLGNSIFLGQITSIHRNHSGSWHHGESIEIEFQVKETLVGWINGTTVTLKAKNINDAIGRGLFSDELCSSPSKSKLFFIAVSHRKLSDLRVADGSFLSAIQSWDAE